jgi:acetophenone carboxylase
MEAVRRITEYLDLDLEREMWICNRCRADLVGARQSYKEGCLAYARDPRTIHPPIVEGAYTFSPDPDYCLIVEFYCPGCGTLIETEYLPPGHPLTSDIELDLDLLKTRAAEGSGFRP